MNTTELYTEAKREITNCMYCLETQGLSPELAGEIRNVAEHLLDYTKEDIDYDPDCEWDEDEIVEYINKFRQAAEDLWDAACAMNTIRTDWNIITQED